MIIQSVKRTLQAGPINRRGGGPPTPTSLPPLRHRSALLWQHPWRVLNQHPCQLNCQSCWGQKGNQRTTCLRASVSVRAELPHCVAAASALITGETQRLQTDGQTTTDGNGHLIANTRQVFPANKKWSISLLNFQVHLLLG